MGKRYSREVKEEVLAKIRSGQKVSEVAQIHGMSEMTIRTWLGRDAAGGGSMTLEVSRLRRENAELVRIIGELKVDSERQKKKSRRVFG